MANFIKTMLLYLADNLVVIFFTWPCFVTPGNNLQFCKQGFMYNSEQFVLRMHNDSTSGGIVTTVLCIMVMISNTDSLLLLVQFCL